MSLVPVVVKADDGFFYKNPVIMEKDFFICFDDDDEPELVIKRIDFSENRVNEILAKYNATRCSKNMSCQRLFKLKNLKFEKAICFFIEIKSPIPVKSITEHDGQFDIINFECVIYKFEYDNKSSN